MAKFQSERPEKKHRRQKSAPKRIDLDTKEHIRKVENVLESQEQSPSPPSLLNWAIKKPEKKSSKKDVQEIKGGQSDIVHAKREREALGNTMDNWSSLEISIPAFKQKGNSSMAYPDSKQVASPDHAAQEGSSIKEQDEDLWITEDSTESYSIVANDQSSDGSHSSESPESSESSESSSDEDSDLEFEENYLGQVKKATSGKKATQKRKASSALNEKVKALMRSDILSAANANASDAHQFIPISQKRNKAKALAEDVAKLPAEDQPQARKDLKALIEYSKHFEPSAKIVDMNWKIGGLKTHLRHHQLKAAAWMRGRESSDIEPNGGLLCDEMGLGKTLTVLSVIAHEKSRPKAPTLIVVPRSLVTQWIDQISKHCGDKISNDLLEHFPGSKTSRRNVVAEMQKKRIVMTTYEEVYRSHPRMKPPVGTTTPEDLKEWKATVYNRNAGPLHKVEWKRIILDEAHVIKNKDSGTSIAVRALSGKFKWVLSGTPLHNKVEELYPYLDFIYRVEKIDHPTFLRMCSNGLDELLETVLHRSTYSDRILGKPIVTLPGINRQVIEVDFFPAEKYLYEEMIALCINIINGMADIGEDQTKCILALITMVRMFTSHLLLAQRVIEQMLDDRVITNMKGIVKAGDSVEISSRMIVKLILASISSRPRAIGNFFELHTIFDKRLKDFPRKRQEFETERKKCPHCNLTILEGEPFVVTSCQHVYCKGCFDELPDQDGKLDTVTRVCSSCKKPIEEAGYSDQKPNKRKQSNPNKKGKKAPKNKRQKSLFKKLQAQISNADDWDEPGEDETDWISRIGDRMPSAKIAVIRDLVAKWIEEDKSVKIVIFVQFLKTIRLLEYMCIKKGWKHTMISGKLSPPSRDEQIQKFDTDKDINILLSSLKTGGVGLNLTMANKCILVDPWWNEAIQEQAYCRLYRIGQPRTVEYVQIVVKGSVDTWLVELQKKKAWDIDSVLSKEEMLGLFGTVHEGPDGLFSIQTDKEKDGTQPWKKILKSGIFYRVNSGEEEKEES